MSTRPALIVVASLLVLPVRAADQQAFRARTDLVSVDVLVLSGNRPVAGLAADDFVLNDNKVPQRLELVSVEAIPIDLTLVLEGNHIEDVGQLNRSLERIRAMLSPDDRLRLLTFSNALREAFAWQTADRPIDLDDVTRHGHLWPRDPLAMVMIQGGSGDRRHLVALFTGGGLGLTVVRPGKMLDIATRFDGVVHVVLFGNRADDELRDIARATGGELHRAGSVNRTAETFERIFDTFRRSYVLRYMPQGVAHDGWHEIDVTVTRPGGNRYTVRARKGYWNDAR